MLVEPVACLQWAVAAAPRAGETRSGDLCVVRPLAHGALVAVVDGVGHGPQAAAAAQRASETIAAHAGRSVIALARQCHDALAGTRGAVMAIAQLDTVDESLSWLAVGNVDGVLLRAAGAGPSQREGVIMRGGVVGHQLPILRAAITTVAAGDLLVLATDGIGPDFRQLLDGSRTPDELARAILATCGRATDDALVLVARYLGAESCAA